jgi:CDP-diacylglycerol--glycerol-3-phosphate 3-phosphatidyltransferase
MRIPKSLGMNWWTTACISFCAVIGVNLLIISHWRIPFSWARFVLPLLPLIYVLAVLRSGLPLNHRPGETQVLAHLGLANGITVLRGVLVSALACFWNWPATIPFSIHQSLAWLPGVIYITAALLDLVDGMVARHTDHVTRLGERLDTLFDALGLLTAVLAGIALNQLPLSYLAVALAYYAFSAGIWVRRRTGRMVIPLEPRPAARLIAGFNMGFVGATLLPIYRPPATTIGAIIFMAPFLAGFLRDWLVVSGRMKTGHSQPAPWEKKWRRLFREVQPVVLRAVLLLSFLAALEKTAACFSGNAMGPFYFFGPIVRPIFLLSVVLVSLGVMGRLAALPILLLSGLWVSHRASDPLWCLLMIAAAGLLITGSGNLSLWQPEEKYLGVSTHPLDPQEKQFVRTHVINKEAVFQFESGRVKKIALPGDEMMAADINKAEEAVQKQKGDPRLSEPP